jgi:acyl carrier protein
VRTLDPMPLPPVAEGQRALRHGGSYLITGGLGNVGLALARFLATTVQARLTLVGRSGLESDTDEERPRADAVRELEAAGAEVHIVRADVTRSGQLASAIEEAERRFGVLHGVVHAAGVTTGETFKTLDGLTRTAFEGQFEPKWHGVVALREALGERVLDFCLLTSSVSVELGGLRFGAYAAANTVMDHLCEQFNREDATRWISVDWDAWDFEDALQTGALELAFLPEEGGETFDRILAVQSPPIVAVCTGDFPTRLAGSVLDLDAIAEPETKYERPDLDTEYEAPTSETEIVIAVAWAKSLGLERVGANDDFFELGGDSLLAIQFMGELNSTFKVDIGVQTLFDAPTVAGLAREVEIRKVLVANPQPDGDSDEEREEFVL